MNKERKKMCQRKDQSFDPGVHYVCRRLLETAERYADYHFTPQEAAYEAIEYVRSVVEPEEFAYAVQALGGQHALWLAIEEALLFDAPEKDYVLEIPSA